MPTSLAQFVFETREKRGFSQHGLAKKSNIPLETIEKIEAGQELFLATVIRQKLAKALKVEPNKIKALEKDIEEKQIDEEYIERLKELISSGVLEGLKCPVCKSELICRVAEMYDLEDNLIRHPKARCTKCPFQLK